MYRCLPLVEEVGNDLSAPKFSGHQVLPKFSETSMLPWPRTLIHGMSSMLAAFIFVVATTLCDAQNTPGLPDFVSRDGDVVLSDLTVLINIPVKSPHPMSLVFSNTVPSSRRFVFTDGSGLGPYSQIYPGTITINVPCNNGNGGSTNQLSGWTYISGSGTVYIFPRLTTDTNSCLTGDVYTDTDGPLTASATPPFYTPGGLGTLQGMVIRP
jgi:hypothetical protein